jgi:hypothetical protein
VASESELYSGTGSLPARREVGAPVRARLRMWGPRAERSRGEGIACDGWVAGSHAMAHGDVEFELEADSSSKSAWWLKSEISPNLPASSPVTTLGSVTKPVFGLGFMVRRR